MDSKLGWGIIGTGGIAALQVRDLLAAGLHPVAVGSRRLETAEQFASEHGILRAHPSYHELVNDPEVDIVYVATPHPLHMENALAAIEAGKHVVVEKVFTISAEQAQRVADAARARGVFVMEAMWTRFLPCMQRVIEVINEGTIGEPRVLIADHNQYIPRTRAARLHEPELGGGALLDLGIYPLSFAWRLFGAPQRVTARATLTALGVDELTAVIMEYESGEQASIHTGFMTPGPNRAAVVASHGRIELDPVWYTQTGFTVYNAAGEVIERYDAPITGRGMQYQALEAERCIKAGLTESPVMPLSETVAIMECIDEILAQIGVSYS